MLTVTTALKVFISIFILSIFLNTSSYTQTQVIDDFSKKALPGWYWSGNLTMKYSHSQDNAENGYAEILTVASIKPNSFLGLLRKEEKIQVVQNNILSVMLQGVENDVNVTVQLLFDKNGDFKYDEKTDARIESKSIDLNFSGWKEVHLNINEEEFKVISTESDDFSLLEQEAIGIQLNYSAGQNYKGSELLTGVALITERPNKESKQETAADNDGDVKYNLRNFPNPFNPETHISFTLIQPSSVKLTIYDRLGREMAVVYDGTLSEGDHSIPFNGSNLTSGIYFYRLKTSEGTEVRKMVLAK